MRRKDRAEDGFDGEPLYPERTAGHCLYSQYDDR